MKLQEREAKHLEQLLDIMEIDRDGDIVIGSPEYVFNVMVKRLERTGYDIMPYVRRYERLREAFEDGIDN